MKKSIKVVAILLFFLIVIFIFFWGQNSGKETAVEAIEDIRGANTVAYILHEDLDSSGGYIYYLKNMNSELSSLSVEYVNKTWNGKWKLVYGGGHTGSSLLWGEAYAENVTPITYQYLRVVKERRYRIPNPVIFGRISNPEIARIVVKDYQTGLERQVNIVPVNEQFRFYFVNLTNSQGLKFDVIAFNGKNEVVYEETFDEEVQSSGSAGTKQE